MYKLPEYISDKDFNQTELESALKSGEFNNQRDSYNNLIIKSDKITNESKVGDYLVAVPTEKKKQISQQIETFYDMDISEFPDAILPEQSELTSASEVTSVVDEVEAEIEEQQLLQSQIDELSDKLDEEIDKGVRFQEDAASTFSASRDLIISQRIKAGEGVSPSDFSETFPFLPLSESDKLNNELPREQFPFMGT